MNSTKHKHTLNQPAHKHPKGSTHFVHSWACKYTSMQAYIDSHKREGKQHLPSHKNTSMPTHKQTHTHTKRCLTVAHYMLFHNRCPQAVPARGEVFLCLLPVEVNLAPCPSLIFLSVSCWQEASASLNVFLFFISVTSPQPLSPLALSDTLL